MPRRWSVPPKSASGFQPPTGTKPALTAKPKNDSRKIAQPSPAPTAGGAAPIAAKSRVPAAPAISMKAIMTAIVPASLIANIT